MDLEAEYNTRARVVDSAAITQITLPSSIR